MKIKLVERKETDVVLSMSIEEAQKLRAWMDRNAAVFQGEIIDLLYNELHAIPELERR